GLEVAERAWAESGLERAWEIVEALAARAGDLAPVAAYRARLLARLGRHTEARREAARADILKQRRLPPNA
ncbi:MAG: hypothetical protein HY320_15865, partial [Armatimonadetes bacterium]|nr:hypothetical protein [Armatimonadota bacterium]